MRFKKLTLYTNKLNEELDFYSNQLGFEILEQHPSYFTVKIGWSELTFAQSEKQHTYHYCFLIPSDLLNQALQWMAEKTRIIDIENGRKTQHFETWNATSFYFYDASGNIAELIVRYDLNNENGPGFDLSKVLCINEIGMPTTDIEQLNAQLKSGLQTDLWKGDLLRFGTNGNQEGIFLLPNYTVKNTWFPTDVILKPEPFEALVENEDQEYLVEFSAERLKITPYHP